VAFSRGNIAGRAGVRADPEEILHLVGLLRANEAYYLGVPLYREERDLVRPTNHRPAVGAYEGVDHVR
jgi:hypothetical protein